MSGMIRSILENTAWTMKAPGMFGALHLALLALSAAFAVSGASQAKRLNNEGRIKLLAACGWLLAVFEVYKQLFLFHIVNGGVYDWWYFPFQLCSVPMYLCILLPLIPERSALRSAMLTFMAGFTFISAAAALIYPQDFLRSYVTLTAHGFIWHAVLLFISLTIGLSGMADLSGRGIRRSVMLFLVLCAAAVSINIYAEPLMQSANASGALAESYAAMFYLNPYHISPQPVVGAIQKSAGIPAGLALYIAALAAASIIADILFRRFGKDHTGC